MHAQQTKEGDTTQWLKRKTKTEIGCGTCKYSSHEILRHAIRHIDICQSYNTTEIFTCSIRYCKHMSVLDLIPPALQCGQFW